MIVGIATDGGTNSAGNNPRSGNYTYSSYNSGTAFSKPWVVLNKAYGQYTPDDRLTLSLGKMDNPVWEPMEFLWDADNDPALTPQLQATLEKFTYYQHCQKRGQTVRSRACVRVAALKWM